jgi:hypothetical protein
MYFTKPSYSAGRNFVKASVFSYMWLSTSGQVAIIAGAPWVASGWGFGVGVAAHSVSLPRVPERLLGCELGLCGRLQPWGMR